MNRINKRSLQIFFLLSTGFLLLLQGGIIGCGGEANSSDTTSSQNTENSSALSITPSSTTVKKGEIQQFTANQTVAWSVSGGDSNGSIDSNGLYTAPNPLPLNPEILIVATGDTEIVTATVHLMTGDGLTFEESAAQINDTSFATFLFLMDALVAGFDQHLAVTMGSVHLDSIWTGGDIAVPDVFFNQETDFLGFGSETNLSSGSTDPQGAASIVSDENHNISILFLDIPSTGSIQLTMKRSTDGGGTFSSPITLNPDTSVDQVQPSLRLDSQNKLHVAYVQSLASTKILYTQSDDGTSWSTPVSVAEPTVNSQNFPSVAVDPSSGAIYVCYTDDVDGGGPTPAEIRVATSVNGGSSFSAPVNLSHTASDDEYRCQAALGPNGEIYIVWEGNNGSDSGDIFFVKSSDGGGSFTSPSQINSDITDTQSLPYLAVDSLGRIDIVWASSATESILYSRSLDGGITFSENQSIAGGSPATFVYPSGLIHDTAGRLYLQFLSDVNNPASAFDVFYVKAE